VTPPVASPVSLDEAKAHMRVDGTDSDLTVQRLVSAATDYVDGDGVLGRAMITQTWAQWVPQSPGRVRLVMGPFQSLTSVEYYDADGALQSAVANDFRAEQSRDIVEIVPKENATWPGTQTRPDAIKITYVAGYGDAATDVPEAIRHAILLLAAHWYERREAAGEVSLTDTPMAFDALIGRHRVGWYG